MKPVAVEMYLDRIVRRGLTPEVAMFEQLLRAWVASGNDATAECFEGILLRLQHFKLPQTVAMYALQIQHHANDTNAQEIDLTLERMPLYALKPNMWVITETIRGYSDAGQPGKATKYWRTLLELEGRVGTLRWALTRSAVRIIKSYKRGVELASRRIPTYTKDMQSFSKEALGHCGSDEGLIGSWSTFSFAACSSFNIAYHR